MSFAKALGLTAVLYFTILISGFISASLYTFFSGKNSENIAALLSIAVLLFSYFVFWKYFLTAFIDFKQIKNERFDENLILPLIIIAISFTIVSWPLFDLYYKYTLPPEIFKANFRVPHEINFSRIVMLFSSLIIAPVAEELFFRKILLGEILKKHSLRSALLFSSFLFGLFHLPNWGNFLPPFLLGIISGIIFVKSGKIIYSVIIHFLTNTNVFLLNQFGKDLDENIDRLNFNIWYWIFVAAGISLLLIGLKIFEKNLKKPQEKL